MSSFFQEFSVFIKITNICGLYLPSTTRYGTFLKLLIFTLSIGGPFLIAVDAICFLYFKTLAISYRFFFIMASLCYFWIFIKSTYWACNLTKIIDVLNYWSVFQTEDTNNFRNKGIINARKNARNTCLPLFFMFYLPYLPISIFQIFNSSLYFPSIFSEDINSLSAPFFVAFYQNIGTIFGIFSGIGFDMIFILLLNLLKLELDYLEYTLAIIYKEPENMTSLLQLWIRRHCQLILWTRKMNKFYSLPILGLYLFLICDTCGLIFIAVNRYVSLFNVVLCSICGVSYFVAFFIVSRKMHQIEEKGMKLWEASLIKETVYLSRKSKNVVSIINMACTNRQRIQIKGFLPLNLRTFKEIVLLQYRFYTFIANTIEN